MTCPSRIRHVNAALEEIDGIDAVDVRLREGKVTVRHSTEASIEAMIEALREAGYESSPGARGSGRIEP